MAFVGTRRALLGHRKPSLGWVSDYAISGTLPTVALDFVNGRYYANSAATTLSALVSGSPTVTPGSGMLCNSASIEATGALLTAFKGSGISIVAEVSGGSASVNTGIISFGTTTSPLFQDSANQARFYNGASYNTANTATWTATNWLATAFTSSIGAIALNGGAAAPASSGIGSPSVVYLGSFNGGSKFGGYLQTLLVYAHQSQNSGLTILSAGPQSYGYFGLSPPFSGNAIAPSLGNYVSPGNVLAYQYTQPWTAMAVVQCAVEPGTAGIIFSNVTSTSGGDDDPGYELWINPSGQLQVRIIHSIAGAYIGVYGTTNICDGTTRVVGATYDGSGLAAGVKLYVGGVLQIMTTESDTLGGSTIIGINPQQFVVGNQYNHTNFYLPGVIDEFSLSNVARSQSYMTTYAAAPPPVDANTVISYGFNEGTGTTTVDRSANGYTGTLTSTTLWDWQF